MMNVVELWSVQSLLVLIVIDANSVIFGDVLESRTNRDVVTVIMQTSERTSDGSGNEENENTLMDTTLSTSSVRDTTEDTAQTSSTHSTGYNSDATENHESSIAKNGDTATTQDQTIKTFEARTAATTTDTNSSNDSSITYSSTTRNDDNLKSITSSHETPLERKRNKSEMERNTEFGNTITTVGSEVNTNIDTIAENNFLNDSSSTHSSTIYIDGVQESSTLSHYTRPEGKMHNNEIETNTRMFENTINTFGAVKKDIDKYAPVSTSTETNFLNDSSSTHSSTMYIDGVQGSSTSSHYTWPERKRQDNEIETSSKMFENTIGTYIPVTTTADTELPNDSSIAYSSTTKNDDNPKSSTSSHETTSERKRNKVEIYRNTEFENTITTFGEVRTDIDKYAPVSTTTETNFLNHSSSTYSSTMYIDGIQESLTSSHYTPPEGKKHNEIETSTKNTIVTYIPVATAPDTKVLNDSSNTYTTNNDDKLRSSVSSPSEGLTYQNKVKTNTRPFENSITTFSVFGTDNKYTPEIATQKIDGHSTNSVSFKTILEASTISYMTVTTGVTMKSSKVTENMDTSTAQSGTEKWSRKNTITTTTTVVPTCRVSQIEIVKSDIGTSNVTTEWLVEMDDSHFDICNFTLYVNCNSTDEKNLDWIIMSQSTEVRVIDNSPISIIRNLSEFTNYTCLSELKNDNDDVLTSNIFNVTTLGTVPSAVNFNIVEISATKITISWDMPHKIPGNLKMYHIIVKNKGPKHFIRKECKPPHNGSEVSVSFFTEAETVLHILTEVEPNHEYEIQILAENEEGNSTGMPQLVLTNSSRSTVPLNVTSGVISWSDNCHGIEYNASLVIKWELPCNTHGKLKEFEIRIMGNAQDEFSTGWSETEIVSKNKNITDVYYDLDVPNLNASFVYNFFITPISGEDLHGISSGNVAKYTPVGCPSEPSVLGVTGLSPTRFSLKWREPDEYYGNILDYEVDIRMLEPTHFVSKDDACTKFPQKYPFFLNETYLVFDKGMANWNYCIIIRARTAAGFGKYSECTYFTTRAQASEPIRDLTIVKVNDTISNETYEVKVMLQFKGPCNTNGPFRYYAIGAVGNRFGYNNDTLSFKITDPDITYKEITLNKPAYNYTFEIEVVSENFRSNIVKTSFVTDTGVPPVLTEKIALSTNGDSPTQIDVVFNRKIFSNISGDVLYYAIILMKTELKSPTLQYFSYGFWSDDWPSANKTVVSYGKPEDIVQLTSDYWNPFKAGIDQINFSIGKKTDCVSVNYCHSLLEDTHYIIVLRGLTRTTYREVYTLVKTGTNSSSLGIILTFIFLFILATVVGIVLYLFKRRSLWISFKSISDTSVADEVPRCRYAVSVKHFISYYNKITNDSTLLKKQYEEIEDENKIYKQQNVHTAFAMKPENRRKNRYTNILPYDEYRVKLNIDEDDEICSDYINASYIKGYSGDVEYIATQGPLEHTCKDFWKMVIQENVTVIVMVSLFIEKEKEKCFKYFPNNHEIMLISEDIEVKCQTELQFDTYCIRTLLVRKDVRQYSVIHMQYLDWPDFGCPSGTNNMLSFCQEVRDRIQLEQGLMIVHCSAGVGRTGTLISLDILLQAIRRKKQISVFETVMELRRQRTHMVQTEKQFVYIHTCIKDALENSSLYLWDDLKTGEEHFYENIFPKNSSNRNSEAAERESAF